MSARAFNRWQAAGTHLLICLAIAAVVVALMLAVWYPPPLFEAAGGSGLLVILLGVDVILGPLLTLVVFKSGKRGLKFDLGAIALLQVAALVYGLHVVALARPAFVVFIKDRFDLATAVDLEPDELANAKFPQFRSAPWTGPVLVFAEFPTDPKESQIALNNALAGKDLHFFPKYYVPYQERRQEVLAKAAGMERLRQMDPPAARVVEEYVKAAGIPEATVRVLLLRTRFAWVAVLIDPQTALPVKMLISERILK